MTPLETAVVEIAEALDCLRIPHMLVGGLAVSLWGEPRATLDVDLVMWVEPADLSAVLQGLLSEFRALPEDPQAFVRETRVLPVVTKNEVRADLIFAALPYEREAIGRAFRKQVGDRSIPVASLEDLVVAKLVSGRERDLEDAQRLLRRFRGELDHDYLHSHLAELSDLLGRPEILDTYRTESGRS